MERVLSRGADMGDMARQAAGPAGAGPVTSDDAALIARSLHAPECFGVLFDRHAPAIGRYIARRLGPDVADDLAAETFLVAQSSRSPPSGTVEWPSLQEPRSLRNSAHFRSSAATRRASRRPLSIAPSTKPPHRLALSLEAKCTTPAGCCNPARSRVSCPGRCVIQVVRESGSFIQSCAVTSVTSRPG